MESGKENLALLARALTMQEMLRAWAHDARHRTFSIQSLAIQIQENLSGSNLTGRRMKQTRDAAGALIAEAASIDLLIKNVRLLLERECDPSSSFSLHEVVENVGRMIDSILRRRGVQYFDRIDRSLVLRGSRDAMSLVFTNLAINSVDSLSSVSKNRGGSIFIDGKKSVSPSGEESIDIRFRDNGPGVPQDLARNDALFQVGTSQYKDKTGLGLPLCRQILSRDFGATVRLASCAPAEFQILIPVDSEGRSTSETA